MHMGATQHMRAAVLGISTSAYMFQLTSACALSRYCGTFGRTCAFEGQYAMHSGHGLRNFSEEQLVECIGWTKDQFGYVAGSATEPGHGFEDMNVYPPYVEAGYKDTNPPIPGHPCKYDKSKVIVGTNNGWVRSKALSLSKLSSN